MTQWSRREIVNVLRSEKRPETDGLGTPLRNCEIFSVPDEDPRRSDA